MSRKKIRAHSYLKRDETHLGITFHAETTLLLFICSSHPGMIEIRMSDKHLICFKRNSFIPRWVLNFYSHDEFSLFAPWMEFHPCQDRDEIIPGQNFTLPKTWQWVLWPKIEMNSSQRLVPGLKTASDCIL